MIAIMQRYLLIIFICCQGVTVSQSEIVNFADKNQENENLIRHNEEQDRNEFIFFEEIKTQQKIADIMEVDQDSDDDVETTTDYKLEEIPERVKRNPNNIIEEENIASTVSGLKFTGRDTRLNSNFYFRNINS